jgi:hypothetical protein
VPVVTTAGSTAPRWLRPASIAKRQIPALGGLSAAGRAGELSARVTAALWWERLAGEEQIEGFEASRAASQIGRLKATSIKMMVDDTTGNFSASVLDP